jgi:molecular chaperone HtpG
MSEETIPFQIEITKVIDLLANQIYQSPLALLRENCQNAFDAILMRMASDSSFQPLIEININLEKKQISVKDNGIGMSRKVLKDNYWKAGSSGKNNQEAKNAGVVGTFGIGAMANFGIAESLTVNTKSIETGESVVSIALRNNLSATENCISINNTQDQGDFGTTVYATVQGQSVLNLAEAKNYIEEVVRYAEVEILFNNTLISQKNIFEAETPPNDPAWVLEKEKIQLGSAFTVNFKLKQMRNGDIWICLTDIFYNNKKVKGEVILRQNKRQIKTFRSKFALAPVSVSSLFGFGGIANLSILEPTAGREALRTQSIQILQSLITELENCICPIISKSEYAILNTAFLNWVVRSNSYALAGMITVNSSPKRTLTLNDIKNTSQTYNVYAGNDPSIIEQYTDEECPLILLNSSNPRRRIENTFLNQFCTINQINNEPQLLSSKTDNELNSYEASFALRIISILNSDYFVKAKVTYGTISHNLPVLIQPNKSPIQLYLNSSNPSIATFLKMYESDFLVMTGVAKDFIRNSIFPKISSLVPSSTRKGAEAFLKAIKGPKDIFEYEKSDQWNLNDIWHEYLEGEISLEEAAVRSTSIVRETIQVVDQSLKARVSDIIPDVVKNQEVLDKSEDQSLYQEMYPALPAITRMDQEVDYKILTMDKDESPLNGYKCFLALSDRVRAERVEFFLQPHKTEIIWGGQKVLFIFQHHSGEFGLYYELKNNDLITALSGGGEKMTSTIILKNKIFIPIPQEIESNFIPFENEKKSFEVRCELLYPDGE